MDKLDHHFADVGAYVLFDGQFGSTGKGLAAAYLAENTSDHLFGAVLTNAGPNSGHTFYAPPHVTQRKGEEPVYHDDGKVVLKQLPSFPVYKRLRGMRDPIIGITAGAVIDPAVLEREMDEYRVSPFIHPNAALITSGGKDMDVATVSKIASTGQGVGPALQRKMGRVHGLEAIAMSRYPRCIGYTFDPRKTRVLLEVSQGFSLGINQPFYPYVTSRECSAAQAMSDAGISPYYYRGGVMCIRTFPIRVGNAPNGASSGDCYPDQRETTWEELGVEPELTTVTKRQRRVFTFSLDQYCDALRANTPTIVFVNFLNYIPGGESAALSFIDELRGAAYDVLGYHVGIIGGWGPRVEDCKYYGF